MGYWADTENGTVFGLRGLPLKGSLDTSGYLGTQVKLVGRSRSLMFHQLVAYIAFGVEAFQIGEMIRHLDGNKTNNKSSNLAWGTNGDNQLDIPRTSRVDTAFARARNLHVLQAVDVVTVRAMLADGIAQQNIADLYGVSQSTISAIHRGVNYSRVI